MKIDPDTNPRLMPPRSGAGRVAAVLAGVALLLVAAGGAWWWLSADDAVPADLAPAIVQAPVGSVDVPPPVPAPVASAPPIEPPPVPPGPLAAGEVDAALAALLGADAVQQWLLTADFATRLVATVDNLGRAQAPASRWPVKPTDGRFTTVERDDGSTVIAPDNAARYAPFVALVEAADADAAVALYARLYPLLQQAYVDLGYPRGRFNDRLVQVIDLLLATPTPEGPLSLRLVEVKGPIASTRPWLRYEFADPELEALAAGQKMLLRTGPDHARRLKAKLLALREALQRAAATPSR